MKVAILGSGFTGMTLAYELMKKGIKTTVFEKEKNIGGLASTIKINDIDIERCYHHIFTSDNYVLDLANELGLKDKIKWYHPTNSIYSNNMLYPFTTPFNLLNYKEISFFSRIKLGLLVFKAMKIKDWKQLENMTAKDWIIKNAGILVYEKVWKPLLQSKFDIDAENVSAVWIWNKFKLRGSSRDKSLKGELLGYMDGSFMSILNNIKNKLEDYGSKIQTNSMVTKITPCENKIYITYNQIEEEFDKVYITFSPREILNIIDDSKLTGEFLSSINNINYKANICILCKLNRSISDYYWTTVSDDSLPFVAVIEHTSLIKDIDYKSSILYLTRYLDEKDQMYNMSDKELEELFLSSVNKIYNIPIENYIQEVYITREKYTQPVITKNYSDRLLPFITPIENLYICSMSQIYPEDRGINYSIKLAKKIAGMEDVFDENK